jgi:hypothetical protein
VAKDKHKRNLKKCARYRSEGRQEKNKQRRAQRRLRELAKAKAARARRVAVAA